MEAFGKTMFLFVFPIYIWLISAAIVILSHRYIFFTKLVGMNALKVLSTLILLSYSKMLRVTIGALRLKSVEVYFNSSSSASTVRWALDGNIPYLDAQRHLVLFVIAIVFVMLLLPFSMSLLCIRRLYSLSNYCKVFLWIIKLKPFFDTYTGPYKDNTKFWTGLLLLVRLVLLIVHTLDYKSNTIPYYIVIAVCLFLLTLMVLLHGVYQARHLNILECFFLLNICLVFLINTYERGSEMWVSAVSHLLVSLVFLVFIGILAYHTYRRCSQRACIKRLCFKSQSETRTGFDDDTISGMRDNEPLFFFGKD